MGAHFVRDSDRGGGVGNDGDISLEEAEYVRALHCYAIRSGLLQGNREEAGDTVGDVVLRAGGH